MNTRRVFEQGKIFHLCNKSIANYGIFKDESNSLRFLKTLYYYNKKERQIKISRYLKNNKYITYEFNLLNLQETNLVKIIAYCIMPDHYHLLIKVLIDNTLSKYISDVENSFTRYFNIKFKRKGPLWQSRFRSVEINTDEQLLHVSRYIHLNPTTSKLVSKPEEWKLSSYKQYINNEKILKEIMTEITISNPVKYKRFCENNIDYQRKLKRIKNLFLD